MSSSGSVNGTFASTTADYLVTVIGGNVYVSKPPKGTLLTIM